MNKGTTDLSEVSKPLSDYLAEHYNPLAIAIVTCDRVDILEAEEGAPLIRHGQPEGQP